MSISSSPFHAIYCPIARESPPLPSHSKCLTRAVADVTAAHVVIPFTVDRICCLALYHHTLTPRAYAHTSRGPPLSLIHGHPQLYDQH